MMMYLYKNPCCRASGWAPVADQWVLSEELLADTAVVQRRWPVRKMTDIWKQSGAPSERGCYSISSTRRGEKSEEQHWRPFSRRTCLHSSLHWLQWEFSVRDDHLQSIFVLALLQRVPSGLLSPHGLRIKPSVRFIWTEETCEPPWQSRTLLYFKDRFLVA